SRSPGDLAGGSLGILPFYYFLLIGGGRHGRRAFAYFHSRWRVEPKGVVIFVQNGYALQTSWVVRLSAELEAYLIEEIVAGHLQSLGHVYISVGGAVQRVYEAVGVGRSGLFVYS